MTGAIALAWFTEPQWRLLTTLHDRHRCGRRPISCRALLADQEANIDDLLAMQAFDLVEGYTHGSLIDLTRIDWAKVNRHICTRITSRGTEKVTGQPEIMVILALAGDSRRRTITETAQLAGITDRDIDDVLRVMYEARFLHVTNPEGRDVFLPNLRGKLPRALCLSLTSKARNYLPREK